MNKAFKRFLAISMTVLLALSTAACTTTGAPASTDEKKAETTATEEKKAETTADAAASSEAKKEEPKAETKAPTNYPALKQKTDGKIVVAHMLDSLTNESSQRQFQQMKNEVEHRGWTLIEETNVAGNYEADPTRKAFERVMAREPDAIVISFLDIPPIADLIIQARERGIGVYSVGTDLSEGMVLNVESAQGVMGAKIASYAIQRMGGTGDKAGFIDLWMPRGIRRDVVAATLFEKGGWDFGETMHHSLTPEGYTDELFNVVTDWLTKEGDNLDFVWTCWDLGAITAAQAMAAKGFTKDQMFTVGIDGGAQSWAYIRQGELPFVASLADCFEYQIHTTCEAIQQMHVEGKQMGAADCVVPANRYITTDGMTLIIDSANVPAVGENIHKVFNYYGGTADDKDAWFNWGTPYAVKDFVE